MQTNKKHKIMTIIVAHYVTVFFACMYFPNVFLSESVPEPAILPQVSLEKDPFFHISLDAKSVYVFDAATGKVLFAKNEEVQLPLASVTKVMTAFVASSLSDGTVVNVTKEDLNGGNGGLSLGEKWNLKNLLDYTLVVSSNSGASAIAGAAGAVIPKKEGEKNEEAFVREMNLTAKKLGMTQTFYLNPSGLDTDENLAGSYGSAKDMTILFDAILKTKPKLLDSTAYDSLSFTSLNGVSHSAVNTNTVVRTIPGLVASKTGYTDLANGNLVIAFNAGPMNPVIIAVLGSSQEGRFSDVEKLVVASLKKIGQGE